LELINYCTIIINAHYNYIINIYYSYYVCNKDLLEERDKQQNMAVTGAATASCFKSRQ